MSLEELGSFLKNCREKKNISIEELSLKTKLSPSQIKTLESGYQGVQIPHSVFLRSFVKNYLSSLGESPAKALLLIPNEEDNSVLALEPVKRKSFDVSLDKLLPIALGAAFLIFLYFYFRPHSTQEIPAPKQEKTEIEIEQELAPPSSEPIKETIIETPSLPFLEKKKQEIIFPDISEEIIPTEIQKQYQKEMQNIYVSAYNGESFITYYIQGEELTHTKLLKQYSSLFIQGKVVEVRISQPISLEIYNNNNKLTIPSNENAYEFVIPEEPNRNPNRELFVRNKYKAWIRNPH